MTYEQIQALTPEAFKRACGVPPQTFETMLQVFQEHEQQKSKPGRPPKRSLANQLCLALQYWREYRTYFHLGLSWGVGEAVVCRTVRRMANVLITSKAFHVPGKKRWGEAETAWAVIVVDVTESPVERPQKNSALTTVGRRSATRSKRSALSRQRPERSSVLPSGRDESTIANSSNGAKLP